MGVFGTAAGLGVVAAARRSAAGHARPPSWAGPRPRAGGTWRADRVVPRERRALVRAGQRWSASSSPDEDTSRGQSSRRGVVRRAGCRAHAEPGVASGRRRGDRSGPARTRRDADRHRRARGLIALELRSRVPSHHICRGAWALAGWASDHLAGGSTGYSDASCGWGGARRGVGADHLRQRGDRLHDRAGRHRPLRCGSGDGGGCAVGGAAGGEPAPGGPVGLAPPVWAAVRGRLVHDGVAGHDPGHRTLPRLGVDQGDRAADRRPDRRAFRGGHAAGDRGGSRGGWSRCPGWARNARR